MRGCYTNPGEKSPRKRTLKFEFYCYSCKVHGGKELSLDPDHSARQMAEIMVFFFTRQHFQDCPQCEGNNIKAHYMVLEDGEKGDIGVDTLDRGIWGIR